MSRRDVAPLAEERQLAHQHPVVVRTVRVMARDTAFADRRMLPEVRTAFLGVATRAAFVHRRSHAEQLDIGRAVNVVTRRAGHAPFSYGHVRETVLSAGDGTMAAAA